MTHFLFIGTDSKAFRGAFWSKLYYKYEVTKLIGERIGNYSMVIIINIDFNFT